MKATDIMEQVGNAAQLFHDTPAAWFNENHKPGGVGLPVSGDDTAIMKATGDDD